MKMSDAAIVVAEFASEQWGVITAAQARTQGVTPVQMKRLADRGALERVHHGIYYMTRLPYDPLQELRVAWIALEPHASAWERLNQPFPGGVVSHRTAAHMHQLGDIDADLMEFTCQRRIRLTLPEVKIHIGTVETADWTTVNGLPVTTARRTIDDLAAARIDGGHLATIVRDALSRELVSDTEVERTLAAHAFEYGHPLGDGRAFLTALIEQAGVSTNTLALAQVARRQGQRINDAIDGKGYRANPFGLDEASLPFAVAASTGRFDDYLKRVNESLVGDAMKGIVAAQMAVTNEHMRAFLDQSVAAPQADMLRAVTQNLRSPALDAVRESLTQVMAPIARQSDANIGLGLRNAATAPSSEADSSVDDQALPQAESAEEDNA